MEKEKLYWTKNEENGEVLGKVEITETTSFDLMTNLLKSLTLNHLKKNNDILKLKIENENLKKLLEAPQIFSIYDIETSND